MILCNDLALPEGPLAMPDGSWLVTELALRRGCVSVVSADGGRREIAKTGRPNGLARTADGTIWVAESLTPSIVRLTLDGQMETVLTHVGGVPLLWPNDLCVGPDGVIYFTDSGALVGDFLDGDAPKAGFASVTFDGRVGRFDPRTGEAAFIDTGLVFANGIAFGVDGHLYASETFTGEVYRYRIDDGQVSARRERFGFHETSTDDRRTDTRSRPDDPDRALVQHPVPARRESDLRRRDVAERSEGRDRLDRRDHPQRGDVRGGQPHDLRGVSRRAGQPRSLVGRRRPRGGLR